MFNLLPYLEEQALYDTGKGLQGDERVEAILRRDATPLAIMNCPTRRQSVAYPNPSGVAYRNSGRGTSHARGDYAINVGDTIGYEHWCVHFAPASYEDADQDWEPALDFFSGISYCGSKIRLRHIKDGTSHTYAIGERYLDPATYYDGSSPSDNATMYAGFQNETYRSTHYQDFAQPTVQNVRLPLRDQLELSVHEHFFGNRQTRII